MKVTLYYYSATGNSLYAARLLAEQLGGRAELVSIAAVRCQSVVRPASGSIGIVFPMHYFGLPPLVEKFLGKLEVCQADYVFAVVTSGSGRFFSAALKQTEDILKKKGSSLQAGFHVGMISSYIPLSDLPPEAKIRKKLSRADNKLRENARSISDQSRAYDKEPFWRLFAMINKRWLKQWLPLAHRKFACSDACTSCGICETVCPVQNIRLEQGKPVWGQDCQECLACLHFCPVHSIEFGKNTKGRRRYHHPAISLTDMVRK